MQSYYLHQESAPPLAAHNIQSFRINDQPHFIASSRGKYLQIHRLLDGDLTFHGRFSFHAIIEKIEVLPSKHHPYDYLWVLDKKGRFCFWHPQNIDLVDNTILWDYASEIGEQHSVVYSGIKAQLQGKNTQGNIFFTNGKLLVLIKFSITQHGVAFDRNNVIKYHLSGQSLRCAGWIHHSLSLFLVGLIIEEEGKTYLSVYDLQKGIGICKESQEWRLEKTNLLHFVSQVSGEILITTYNEVSLHNYKNQNSLKSYRTRGNYGQGFYLADEGMYGHIGEELIAFNRDRLVSYGQVKANFTSICFSDCKVLGKVGDGTALSVSHYEGDTYLLRIYPKSFTFYHIFTTIGPILEMCRHKPFNSLFAVASQIQNGFQVSLLQSQYRIPVKEQTKFAQKYAEQLLTINGGIYLIISSQSSNEVFRLNRNQQYQEYFSLPLGNILAADGKFIVYDDAIYEIDYQSCMMTVLEQRELLLAQITGEIIYYLDYEGTLHSFDNNCEDEVSTVTSRNRSADYCWGVIAKTNSLIAANLNEPKQIAIIKDRTVKYVSIKGHTLVCSLSSIYSYKSRHESDSRILVGYVDGQIHVQYLKNDYYHSTQVFSNYCSMPVTFVPCGEDTVLVNYTTKQYLLTAIKEELEFVNVSFGREGASRFLFGFLQKTAELCFVDSNDYGKEIAFKRAAASGLKNTVIRQKSKTLKISKLQEWIQSVPKLLSLDDRLTVAGYNEITLINLQNGKQIRNYHHNLKEIISLSSIKMGILLCGINKQNHAELLILSQDLEFLCKFQLQEKKQVRCLKALIQQNQFLLSNGDSVTLYKITDNKQLLNLLGSKLDLQAYHLDICDNTILINDPFRNISILQFKQSINCLGSYLPPYRITHASFIGSDVLMIDERGTITIIYTHIDQTLDFNFKFIKLSSLNIGDTITATYSAQGCIVYASESGQIGVIKNINRDEFDTLKKIQTESLLQNQQHPQFSYWQWRSRSPVHQRLIDSQLFSQNSYFLSTFLS